MLRLGLRGRVEASHIADDGVWDGLGHATLPAPSLQGGGGMSHCPRWGMLGGWGHDKYPLAKQADRFGSTLKLRGICISKRHELGSASKGQCRSIRMFRNTTYPFTTTSVEDGTIVVLEASVSTSGRGAGRAAPSPGRDSGISLAALLNGAHKHVFARCTLHSGTKKAHRF